MIGTLANVCAILVGTALGCLLKKGIKPQYEQALFTAMGLAALGIGLQNVVLNIPKSHYPVLFIVSLALGGLLGTMLDLAGRFKNLVNKLGGKGSLSQGLLTASLLYCIGALSIVGPVLAAVKGNYTMLWTNSMLDFVTAMVFGASFGWGMELCAPILLVWQGSIYLVAKYLSATFFSNALIAELSIVGGFLIAMTGLALLKIRDLKTFNFLPALLVPILFFIIKDIFHF
jgi:uncharacterized membrane protein YqgA involved in biofilm formation